jgi:hypothetical protein
MQTQLDLLSAIWKEIAVKYTIFVPAPVKAERSSFLLLQVLIPLALVVVPGIVGFIRGFFSKREVGSK